MPDWPTDWLSDFPTECLVGSLLDWLFDWVIDRLTRFPHVYWMKFFFIFDYDCLTNQYIDGLHFCNGLLFLLFGSIILLNFVHLIMHIVLHFYFSFKVFLCMEVNVQKKPSVTEEHICKTVWTDHKCELIFSWLEFQVLICDPDRNIWCKWDLPIWVLSLVCINIVLSNFILNSCSILFVQFQSAVQRCHGRSETRCEWEIQLSRILLETR